MYNVKTLNKIAACGTDLLDRSKYTVGDDIDNPQAILVRSASMHEMELGDDLLGLLISSRKVTAAIDWAKPLKGKGD